MKKENACFINRCSRGKNDLTKPYDIMFPNDKDELFHTKDVYEAISRNNKKKDLCSKGTEFVFHLTPCCFTPWLFYRDVQMHLEPKIITSIL